MDMLTFIKKRLAEKTSIASLSAFLTTLVAFLNGQVSAATLVSVAVGCVMAFLLPEDNTLRADVEKVVVDVLTDPKVKEELKKV